MLWGVIVSILVSMRADFQDCSIFRSELRVGEINRCWNRWLNEVTRTMVVTRAIWTYLGACESISHRGDHTQPVSKLTPGAFKQLNFCYFRPETFDLSFYMALRKPGLEAEANKKGFGLYLCLLKIKKKFYWGWFFPFTMPIVFVKTKF